MAAQATAAATVAHAPHPHARLRRLRARPAARRAGGALRRAGRRRGAAALAHRADVGMRRPVGGRLRRLRERDAALGPADGRRCGPRRAPCASGGIHARLWRTMPHSDPEVSVSLHRQVCSTRPCTATSRSSSSTRSICSGTVGRPTRHLSLSPSLPLSLSLSPWVLQSPACALPAPMPRTPTSPGHQVECCLPAHSASPSTEASPARTPSWCLIRRDSPRFAEIRRDSPRSLCDADAALSPLPSRPPSMSEPDANQLPVHGQSGALAAGRRRFALARRAALDAHPSNPASAREERCGCAPSSPRPRLSARSPRQPSSAREAPSRRPDAASRP